MKKSRVITIAVGALALAVVGLCWQPLVAWYRFYSLFESMGRNDQGLPEFRHRATGIVMVRVPGGKFMMGSPEDEEGRREDELQHEVTLSPFLIAKFEVTQATVMKDRSSEFVGDNRPVESISWDDLHGADGFLARTSLLLPTEAQWEFACRAGQEGPYAGTGNLDEMGWYDGNSGKTSHPVGEKKPNAFGLYDMHGNVWELCEDDYDEEFYSKPEATQRDPVCRSGSVNRVLRGGSWLSPAENCRSALRNMLHPSLRNPVFGFRTAYWPLP